jgi:hypothetical protein
MGRIRMFSWLPPVDDVRFFLTTDCADAFYPRPSVTSVVSFFAPWHGWPPRLSPPGASLSVFEEQSQGCRPGLTSPAPSGLQPAASPCGLPLFWRRWIEFPKSIRATKMIHDCWLPSTKPLRKRTRATFQDTRPPKPAHVWVNGLHADVRGHHSRFHLPFSISHLLCLSLPQSESGPAVLL